MDAGAAACSVEGIPAVMSPVLTRPPNPVPVSSAAYPLPAADVASFPDAIKSRTSRSITRPFGPLLRANRRSAPTFSARLRARGLIAAGISPACSAAGFSMEFFSASVASAVTSAVTGAAISAAAVLLGLNSANDSPG